MALSFCARYNLGVKNILTGQVFLKLIALFFLSLSFSALAASQFDTAEGRHFIEVYEQDGSWVVENYLVRPGKLQEKILARSFPLKTQANLFVEELQQGRTVTEKSIKVTTRERNAVAIWKVTRSWDLDWEEKYSRWVEQNLDKDFFVRNNLATDCADVAYALRWIFARNNALPMGATLAGTGVVFTHESGKAEWAQLPAHADWNKDQRFLKALNWLLNNVYTRTLWTDGYPLEISAKSIRPGAINLLGGHTELIARLINDGKTIPIQLLSSTVPRQVRELSGRAMTDGSPVAEDQGGLLQFRWLEKTQGAWVLRAKSAMPLYSREQYEGKLCEGTENFSMCIYQRLGMTFNPRTAVVSMVDSLTDLTRARIAVVRDGISFCAQNNCAPGTQGWEDHSTPTRDARLRAAYVSAEQVIGELSVLDSSLYSLWSSQLTSRMLTEVQSGLSLATFLGRLNARLVSFDPRDPSDSRWASSELGIATTVKNVFDRQEILREKLLSQAASCRQNRSLCSPGTSLFTSNNTLELDYNARTWLARYAHFCLTNTCPANMLPAIWENTWFQSSLPWDGLDLRRGVNPTARRAQVFYGTKYIDEIGDVVLFDQQRLVHRITGKTIPTPANARLVYHPKQKHLLVIHPNALYLWDGARFNAIPLSGDYDTYPVGDFHLILLERSETPSLRIVDLRDGQVRLTGSYYNIQFSTQAPIAAIITMDEATAGKIVFEKQGQYQEIPVSATLAPHRLWGYEKGQWVGSRTDYETSRTNVFSYTAQDIKKLAELPIIYSSYSLGPQWIAQTESATWLLNKNTWLIEKRYPDVWVNQSQMYDMELTQFDSMKSEPMKDLIISRNGQIKEFLIPREHSLIATHPDWLGLQNGAKEFSVVDHDGRELMAPSKQQAPRSCTLRVNVPLDCASSNPQHSGWSYQHTDGRSNWVITNFGTYGKLNTELSPWAQGLWLSDADISLNLGAYTNLEGGSVFSPFSGVMIYFPK